MPKTVEDLEVFKKAHSLALALYQATRLFPAEERYGLCSQIRRAAVSIDANLMEGAYRSTRREYHRFVSISRGSVGELKYLVRISRDLGYLDEPSFMALSTSIDEISRMLASLLHSLAPTH